MDMKHVFPQFDRYICEGAPAIVSAHVLDLIKITPAASLLFI